MEKLDFNIFSNLISKKITSNEFDLSQPIVRDKVFYTYPVKAKMLVLFLMREEELRRKKHTKTKNSKII